ncbi:MAG: ammonium transporter [Oscillospiraceae bacterium]|jgi:Amt family ammonium transporter|nr:ammonium transporter [Oscillospiraceae bacterium]
MELTKEILDGLESKIGGLESLPFAIWFLIGAALVFFMQGGFAMVETGFTRAKNAGNIIMKNLMDFCIGTVVFTFIGYSLMLGVSNGFAGKLNLDIFKDFGNYDTTAGFVFNLVFAATAATIVSGAMAERTKFISYCVYSAVISAIVYPIEAGWVWNAGGWLAQKGYIDFAGSSAIHMVGGITAFIGAAILGPRIGKYATDKKTGKKTARAIPGHSITLGALGVFILWFGWYGFNGAAATDGSGLGLIFLNTTLAPAFATVVAMIFTWIKNGKPDVSMSLNGSLAGLVGITAGCADVNPVGAIIIGVVAGFLVVIAVEVIDKVVKVDDPVGAVAVHGVNGIWGTLAVGLFAVTPKLAEDGTELLAHKGLFYGGGSELFGIQALGVGAIALWTAVTMTIVFLIIKATIGLRVKAEEEISGLDLPEHGLASSYGGFAMAPEVFLPEGYTVPLTAAVPIDQAVPVTNTASGSGTKLTKVTIITNQTKFAGLQASLDALGITGMTVTNVLGYGMQKGHTEVYRGVPVETKLLPKVQVDIVVSKIPTSSVVETAKKALYTGNVGDGKIFVYDVENVVKVRTGEEGYNALQDD